jgi:hypothetical protein
VVAAGLIADVLVDARLSDCFGMSIVVDHDAGRWRARAAS